MQAFKWTSGMCLPVTAWQPSSSTNTLSSVRSPVSSEARSYLKLLPFLHLAVSWLWFDLFGQCSWVSVATKISNQTHETSSIKQYVMLFFLVHWPANQQFTPNVTPFLTYIWYLDALICLYCSQHNHGPHFFILRLTAPWSWFLSGIWGR